MTTATILRLLGEGTPAPGTQPAPAAAIAGEVRLIQDSIGHVQRHVRDILGRLRPLRAAEFGLAAAVAELATFWRARDPALAVEVSVDLDPRPPEVVEEALFRVVQESLSNAVRHARPARIGITLAREAGGVIARIHNDTGRPVPARGAAGERGRGLAGMRERVAALSGTLSAGPVPGGGWLVAACIPEPATSPVGRNAPPRRDAVDRDPAALLPAGLSR